MNLSFFGMIDAVGSPPSLFVLREACCGVLNVYFFAFELEAVHLLLLLLLIRVRVKAKGFMMSLFFVFVLGLGSWAVCITRLSGWLYDARRR